MDDLQSSDEVTFIPEVVEPVVMDIIAAVIKDKLYNETLVQGWVDEICSRTMRELIDSNKPYKYMISCTIMQKNGAGLHLGQSCFWDGQNDNTLIARWPNEKRKDPNAKMVCLLTIFGLAM